MAERKPHRRDKGTPIAGSEPSSQVPSFIEKPASRRSVRRAQKESRKAARAAGGARHKVRHLPSRRSVLTVLMVLVGLAVAAAVGMAVLSNTSAFPISAIEVEGTEHVSAEDIATLASVPEGTTMLNYDADVIAQNLKRNPWVGDVRVEKSLPDKLRIIITERQVRGLVVMKTSSVVWCLGDDNVWIEPLKVVPEGEQTLAEAALAKAREMGAMLITDVPATVNPVAGAPAEDDVFVALSTFHDELTNDFWNQIVSFSAASDESISCILASGVEVSLGSATSIATKEQLVTALLEKYPNRLTYINVRVPASPSYRVLDNDAVQEGTGALGDLETGSGTAQGGQGGADTSSGASGATGDANAAGDGSGAQETSADATETGDAAATGDVSDSGEAEWTGDAGDGYDEYATTGESEWTDDSYWTDESEWSDGSDWSETTDWSEETGAYDDYSEEVSW